ncbi:MAG: F0F1 ATP synthase subunit A [Bacteroidales bacterium]
MVLKNNISYINITGIFLILLFVQGTTPDLKARPEAQAKDPTIEVHDQGEDEESINAGEIIIGHVLDHHEWHIATIGETHISIPLPIILYDQDKKELHAFMSSKFHHGHASYKGFKINTDDEIVPVKQGSMEVDKDRSRPLDFSITKTTTGVFVTLLLMILIFIPVAKKYKRNPNQAPKGFQALLEPLILFVREEIGIMAIGKAKYERFMPFILTMFFFIFFANLIGLVPIFPGGANITGNISVTFVLAAITFLMICFSGNKQYWQHIFNPPGIPWWLKFPIPLIPVIEIVGIFIKPFVLMVRLFANILAGHIIILGLMALIFIIGNINITAGYASAVVSVLFTIFITFLKFLVAFIQAYVFALLSALYIGMAVEESH